MSTSAETERTIEEVKSEKDILRKVRLLQQLLHDQEIPLQTVAQKIGVTSSYICHLLRLRRLPEAIMDGYYAGTISLSHLFIISRVKENNKMLDFYEKVLSDNLSVQKTEESVRDILYGIKSTGDYLKKEDRERVIDKVKTANKNVDIKIIQSRIKSKLILEIKGSLDYTSKVLKSLLDTIENWQINK